MKLRLLDTTPIWAVFIGVAVFAFVVNLAVALALTGCSHEGHLTVLPPLSMVEESPPVAPVLMVFTAKWCHNCPNTVEIEELAEDFPGVILMPVDVDENPMLAFKYRIKRVPTFVLCDDQSCRITHDIQEIRRWLGQRP